MLQYLPQLPLVVAALLAFVASASRIFAASKPFWSGRPAWFQMLAPQIALALGALGSGLAGGVKSWTDLTVVFVGAGALLLPGLPSNRSAAPLPSKTNPPMPPTAKPPTFGGIGPMGGTLTLCLGLSLCLTGCAWFTHSVVPALKHCEPSPAALVSQVEQILISGGDYTKELEQLAVADTRDVLDCAVETAISLLAGKVGADSNAGPAVARGKAYLAAHKDSK